MIRADVKYETAHRILFKKYLFYMQTSQRKQFISLIITNCGLLHIHIYNVCVCVCVCVSVIYGSS